RDDHSDEAPGFGRIVRRAKFEHHLILSAEIDGLNVAAFAQIPEVKLVSILAGQQQFRIHAVLDHIGRAPFARYGSVVAEMPCEVVSEILRTSFDLPSSERLERVMIEREDAAGAFSVRSAESADVDAIGAAVQSVRAAVSGAIGDFFRLNDFDD